MKEERACAWETAAMCFVCVCLCLCLRGVNWVTRARTESEEEESGQAPSLMNPTHQISITSDDLFSSSSHSTFPTSSPFYHHLFGNSVIAPPRFVSLSLFFFVSEVFSLHPYCVFPIILIPPLWSSSFPPMTVMSLVAIILRLVGSDYLGSPQPSLFYEFALD